MSRFKADSYVVAGTTDHITPWKGVHKPAQIMGEGTTFVLSNSGHLQSLINPPTNPKTSFMIGKVNPSSPDAFVAAAREAKGKLVARLAQIGCTRDQATRLWRPCRQVTNAIPFPLPRLPGPPCID